MIPYKKEHHTEKWVIRTNALQRGSILICLLPFLFLPMPRWERRNQRWQAGAIGWRNKPIRGLSHMGGRLTQRSGRGLATAMKTMQRLFLKFGPGGAFLACGQLVGRAGMEGPGRITIRCQTVEVGCRSDLCCRWRVAVGSPLRGLTASFVATRAHGRRCRFLPTRRTLRFWIPSEQAYTADSQGSPCSSCRFYREHAVWRPLLPYMHGEIAFQR